MTSEATLARLVADHRLAVEELFERANAVAESRWDVPRAAGKWMPGQEVKHLSLAYEVFTRDLREGVPMRLIGTPWKRIIWRAIGLTSILYFDHIPAARAPRESRPTEGSGSRSDLLAELRLRVVTFESAYVDAWHQRPRQRVTHPYFGTLSLSQAMKLIAVHTRHHAAFLQRSAVPIFRTTPRALVAIHRGTE
jgi:hypothetical protein